MFNTLKEIAQKTLCTGSSRVLRNLATDIRYKIRKNRARKNYQSFWGEGYNQSILFIAGLPKSGTTWLERMLGEFSAYQEMMLPEAVRYETKHKGSHFFDLPEDTFTRFRRHMILLKLHVHGSNHNKRLLSESCIRHVVMFRDLRDVAVSYYFYVRQTPWHAEYPNYKNLNVKDGLLFFSQKMLPDYIQWIESWERGKDPLRLSITYEQLIADTKKVLTAVLDHFGITCTPKRIEEIVNQNNFKNLSGGREQGKADGKSFFRSGTSGDWMNYFDDRVKEAFKANTADFFVKYGYEKDENW